MMSKQVQLTEFKKIAASSTTDEAVRAVWNTFLPHLTEDTRLELTNGTGDPSDLACIYEARLTHHRNIGTEIGGFQESIRTLRGERHPVFGLSIDTADYHGLAFLDLDLKRLIGFLYVRKEPTNVESGTGAGSTEEA